MQILFVSLAVPFPPTNGHRRRNWALLQALAEEGHELTLVSFEEPHETGRNGSSLWQVCRHVELIPLPADDRSDGGGSLGSAAGADLASSLRSVAFPLQSNEGSRASVAGAGEVRCCDLR